MGSKLTREPLRIPKVNLPVYERGIIFPINSIEPETNVFPKNVPLKFLSAFASCPKL